MSTFVSLILRCCVLAGLLSVGQVAHAALTFNSITVNGGASVTVLPSASITVVVSLTTTGGTDWRSTSWQIGAGSVSCVNHANHDSNGTYSETFTITAPAAEATYSLNMIAGSNNGCGSTTSSSSLNNGIVVSQSPAVASINRASFDPTAANKTVTWTVVFNTSVTGVNAADFSLVQTGGATGAVISSVSGSGTTWTVTANTGTGTAGSVRLNLVDDDTIVATVGGRALGGTGLGNGNFTGQAYTLLPSVCTGAADIVFCDDFERSNVAAVGNGWTVTPANANNCDGVAGNTRCGGIDSDIPPFNTYSNPRANPTRSMFTRWSTVSVDSPVVNLAGKTGAQLSFWMRRGGDAFSEYPEATGENYLVQYLASDSTWKILAQYPSGVQEGQVFTPVIELPPDALHAGFKMRFYQPSGSGDSGSGGAPGVVGYDYWHMDDVLIREVSGPTYVGAFCDNFEAGLGRWSISAEGAPGAANIGDASVGTLTYQSAGHELDMRWGYVSAATFKTDLTGVSGNITYWVRSGTNAARDPANNENLVVEYLSSSGVWTALATYLGSAAAGTSYAPSFAIPANAKHANFRLRFREVAGSGYDRSYWHVDDVCVGDLLPTADLALSKIGGTLVPGSNTTYTLKVTNNGPGTLSGSMAIVDTLPAGLSYLAGNGTGWVCGANGQIVTCNWTGTLANGGVASDLVLTVAVGSGVSGSVTNTATVTGTVNDNVPSNNTSSFTSGNFTPAYVFTDAACTNGIAIGQPGQPCKLIVWSPQTAGQARTGVYLTAVNGSGVPTQLSAVTTTTVGLQFGLSCHDPIADAGIQATFSAASPAALPLCAVNGSEPTTWSTATSFSFAAGSPSVASSYTFNYADVGAIELFMRNAAATSQKASSGTFVVKPFSLVLTDIRQSAAPNTANPAAADATGARFVRASENFSATVTSVNASCAANLSTYTLLSTIPVSCRTPNYGNEATPETVSLSSALVPGLGLTTNPAVLGAFGALSDGSASGTSFTWDEVGIIRLTPSIGDADYLGAGNVTGTTSPNVGRFYPHHFDVVVTPQCGGFVYSGRPGAPVGRGQPFTVSGTAMNGSASPAATTNYDAAGFARDVNLTLSAGGAVGKLYVDLVQGGAGAIPKAKFAGGVGQVNAGDATGRISYVFNTFPTLPTAFAVHAEDADTSVSVGTDGASVARAGRLQLGNAYGSELLDLPIPLEAQYWQAGGYYVTNRDDACTSLAASSISLGPFAQNLSACETQLSPNGTLTLASGKAALRLTRPGVDGAVPPVPNTGSVGLAINIGSVAAGSTCVAAAASAATAANLPWFGGVNPAGRAMFGVFKTPLIYRRENY